MMGFSDRHYVVFGGLHPDTLELSNLNGTNGFVINGLATGDYSGYSVSAAGDVNHDGTDDILIGAYGADPEGRNLAGSTYVVFGKPNLGHMGTLELSNLNGTNGFVINGMAATEMSGYSVSAAGDVNQDGIDDVLIGAGEFWRAYVVFGGPSVGRTGVMELGYLNGANGFVIKGVSVCSVSAAGDVNHDGIGDVLIGACRAAPGGRSDAGSTYVVFGGPSVGYTGTLELSGLMARMALSSMAWL